MSMVIGTNVASLSAQRHLETSRGDLGTSMERLSSGSRINSAMDDAAGLAITDRMTSQINGLTQAVRNSNDAISLSQTAEGALQESTSILQRMRDLAVQGASATSTATDRAAMNSEVTQLKAELSRIGNQTTFNDQTLLDGTVSSNFQIGDNQDEIISLAVSDMRAENLGKAAAVVAVNGVKQVQTITMTGTIAANGRIDYSYNGTIYTGKFDTNVATTMNALVSAINDGAAGNSITATSSGALNLTITNDTKTGTQLEIGVIGGSTDGTAAGVTGSNAATTDGVSTVLVQDAKIAVSAISVATEAAATAAIRVLDEGIKMVGEERSKLGAFSNRLEHTVSNLQSMVENTSAARSRIVDTDFAVESANLAKNQVLQQAGTAMLSQANASTQNVLSLLKQYLLGKGRGEIVGHPTISQLVKWLAGGGYVY